MGRLRIFTVLALVGAVMAELALMAIPSAVPLTSEETKLFGLQTFILSTLSFNYFVAGIIYLYGLHGFKPQTVKAYRLLVYSAASFGFIDLQYPLLHYFGQMPGIWSIYGWSMAVIVPGMLLHFYAARFFAQIAGTKTKYASWRVFGVSTLVVCAVFLALPHVHEIPEGWFAFHQVSAVINMMGHLFVALIMARVLRDIGPSYRRGIKWWLAASAFGAFGFGHLAVACLFGQNTPYVLLGGTAIPFAFVGLGYVVSAYYFSSIRFYDLSKQPKKTEGNFLVSAVVQAAGLASNPRDIDTDLDTVRTISAVVGTGQLSPQQSRQLVQVYLRIESYLIHQEKLRLFTRQELRSRLSEEALRIIETEEAKKAAPATTQQA